MCSKLTGRKDALSTPALFALTEILLYIYIFNHYVVIIIIQTMFMYFMLGFFIVYWKK